MASRRSGKRKSSIEDSENPLSYENVKKLTRDGDIVMNKEDEELVVETYETPIYTNKVRLQSRISARVVVSSDKTVSGKRYEWKRSGDIVEVDEIDAPGLLEKRIGDKTCCGGSPDNLNVFILIE